MGCVSVPPGIPPSGMLRKQQWGVGGIWDQPETLDLLLDYLEDRNGLVPAWEALMGPLKAKQAAETLEASWASASSPPSRPRM